MCLYSYGAYTVKVPMQLRCTYLTSKTLKMRWSHEVVRLESIFCSVEYSSSSVISVKNLS